jgi:hypothetical protein
LIGDSGNGAPPVYGTLGVPSAANVPGGRIPAARWIDVSGNLWLFGGEGNDVLSSGTDLNDLWEFNPSNGYWTWKGGANHGDQPGVYGTLYTPAAGNIPGGRWGSASWIDSSGKFWLFGGFGIDSHGGDHDLNDLWKFDPSTGQWAWMSGSNTGGVNDSGPSGIYGLLGQPSVGNVPGGRDEAVSWIDGDGNL